MFRILESIAVLEIDKDPKLFMKEKNKHSKHQDNQQKEEKHKQKQKKSKTKFDRKEAGVVE